MSAQLAWLHRDDWTFEDLAGLPDDGYRYEILDGRLHVTPPPETRHQDVIENLRDIIRPRLPDGMRFKVGQGLRVPVLGPERYVIPDAVIVTGSRPDLYWAPENVVTAIEVTSPGSQLDDRGNKKELYCEAGIEQYLLVDLAQERVTSYGLERGEYVVSWVLDRDTDPVGTWLGGHRFETLLRDA
ncbi:Uma2 family endonuclease [Kineococcus rhizosphaerae]|uniref:Putative restriction endonuclease n=1 Tax=Kineococcus rhizosphaerae TaxID=559628 RepID=A0A2T0R2I4_9ACTN|nr:Uma2 family endonuclease [Kineococcus rhizosphaerae]PRY13963.1 putative restriction endonuclease [Kineococcus rhizosphaerae]